MFIEFVRGVPLITVLFMASVMLPLFVPDSWSPDKLLRALVGVALFSAAYMAEVVRAGLQAIPRRPVSKARWRSGLSYWRDDAPSSCCRRRCASPSPTSSTAISRLFKDTTLVFDRRHLRLPANDRGLARRSELGDAGDQHHGYAFAAIFYLICCYGMSRYAKHSVETRLARGDKR